MTHDSICLFLPSLHAGGAERMMVNLATSLAQRGADVRVVLAKAQGELIKDVPLENVRMVDLHCRRVLTSVLPLAGYLRREKPAVMLSALDHANLAAIFAKKIARVSTRLVVSVRTTVTKATADTTLLRARLFPLAIRWFYDDADAVIAVSEGTANDLLRFCPLSPDKVHVIYNPVITPHLFKKAEEPALHRWFTNSAVPVILGVGRLTRAKDFSTLIRAFSFVRKKIDARLLILGEGEERPKLESLCRTLNLKNDVELPGYVSNPYPYMKRAAVFVLSSRWEGLPSVLIEALALGTKVVATDCPSGPREILADGKWGRLVPVGDAGKLAEAILETLRQPKTTVDKQSLLRFTVDYAVEEYAKVLGLHLNTYQGDHRNAE
jgi:glycosyltransferase involved in cell wall biosynthesis